MSIAEQIEQQLIEAFKPSYLRLINVSAQHAGHRGHKEAGGGSETHFALVVVSEAFGGMNRVARHQAVYRAIGHDFNQGLHALRIQAHTQAEWQAQQAQQQQ